MRSFSPFVVAVALLFPVSARAQGIVSGRVIEAATGLPLPGATVLVDRGAVRRGDAAGPDGRFSIGDLEPGRWVLTVRFVGFATVVRPDVEVVPGRTTVVDVALPVEILQGEEVVVHAGWFARQADEPSGVAVFSTEEIRRAAGAAADVQRLLGGLPSVARMDDMRNGLAVRGGSPSETRFLVDGIPVPNLNHFPTQGSSGGALGVLAADLIGEVVFRPGAFGAEHGDRLGAVVDLDLRPSTDRPIAFRGDFSMAGAGLFAEGSTRDRRAEWLVGVRRSWVDLLVNTFLAEQADAIPTYSDLVLRAVLRPSSRHRISLLDLAAVDRSGITRASARDHHENLFGTADFDANTVGLRWQASWNGAWLSTTTASWGWSGRRVDFARTSTGDDWLDDRSDEHVMRLAHATRWVPSRRLTLDGGLDVELEAARYRTTLYDAGAPASLDPTVDRTRAGAFVQASWTVSGGVRLDPGLRVDRYATGTFVQPRLALRVPAGRSSWLRLAGGRYVQALPTSLTAQDPAFAGLRPPEALHAVAGWTWVPREAMQVTVDVYAKEYRHLPEDPSDPLRFALDRMYDDALPMPLWPDLGPLSDDGRARARGVEVSVQQRLARRVYGLASLAFHRSEYRDAMGAWRPRIFDNGWIATIDGGWRPDERNQLGARFTYAGGRPSTPFDVDASTAAGTGILDAARVQADRLASYHGLTLRYDRRFRAAGAWIVAYAEVWNVYGRRNVSGAYWDEIEGRVRERLQWGTLPVVGFEVLFR